MNHELQAGFRKVRGTGDQIAGIHWIIEKGIQFQREGKKAKMISASFTKLKSLTVWITKIWGKYFKWWEHQTILPASWEICIQVKKQQLEPDMEQWISSKFRKGGNQGCILSPCIFILYPEYTMWNARLDEVQAGLLGELSITSDMQMTLPLWQKVKRN